jgi:hypothetical protein
VCSSGVGFDPVVDGVSYTFEAAGLYNGLFVMSDRQTGSVWTHFDGTVLVGPLAGHGIELTIEPMAHTTWEQWSADHPDTVVLERLEEYERFYGSSGWGDGAIGDAWLGRQFADTVINSDDRLPGNELVLGVGIGDVFSAYVLADSDGLSVVEDVLGGHPVVAFLDPDNLFGLAYSAQVDGETRSFSVVDREIVDDLGTGWSLEGLGTSGPGEGARLEYVTSFVTEWYGWAAYHPTTAIQGEG